MTWFASRTCRVEMGFEHTLSKKKVGKRSNIITNPPSRAEPQKLLIARSRLYVSRMWFMLRWFKPQTHSSITITNQEAAYFLTSLKFASRQLTCRSLSLVEGSDAKRPAAEGAPQAKQ